MLMVRSHCYGDPFLVVLPFAHFSLLFDILFLHTPGDFSSVSV